jgi:hypothetical protein
MVIVLNLSGYLDLENYYTTEHIKIKINYFDVF